mmetsp:Transcript_13663/g.22299  ORF Transcript_13663/g.22299 Transcript_13663/m.22299 type:complete len:309 (+) Transcript_13663:87-1013(+)
MFGGKSTPKAASDDIATFVGDEQVALETRDSSLIQVDEADYEFVRGKMMKDSQVVAIFKADEEKVHAEVWKQFPILAILPFCWPCLPLVYYDLKSSEAYVSHTYFVIASDGLYSIVKGDHKTSNLPYEPVTFTSYDRVYDIQLRAGGECGSPQIMLVLEKPAFGDGNLFGGGNASHGKRGPIPKQAQFWILSDEVLAVQLATQHMKEYLATGQVRAALPEALPVSSENKKQTNTKRIFVSLESDQSNAKIVQLDDTMVFDGFCHDIQRVLELKHGTIKLYLESGHVRVEIQSLDNLKDDDKLLVEVPE